MTLYMYTIMPVHNFTSSLVFILLVDGAIGAMVTQSRSGSRLTTQSQNGALP